MDEIAEAADVGRMTVFNHFPRKEDLVFDRDAEGGELLRRALRERDPRVGAVETLRRLAHRLVADGSPFVEFSSRSQGFIDAVRTSEALMARARAIRDELALVATMVMAEGVGRDQDDPDARLGAALLLATCAVAFVQAHDVFRRSRSTGRAEAAFLAVIDKGAAGASAALAGITYA